MARKRKDVLSGFYEASRTQLAKKIKAQADKLFSVLYPRVPEPTSTLLDCQVCTSVLPLCVLYCDVTIDESAEHVLAVLSMADLN